MTINELFKFYILIVILSIACSRNDPSIHIAHIDIESGIDNMVVVKLSQFTDDIEYISLETQNESILGNPNNYAIGQKNIIFCNSDMSLVLFDRAGKYKMKFGRKGRGPGEYQAVNNLIVEGEELYFSSGKDLFMFSLSGDFQKKYPDILNPQDGIQLDYITLVDDSLLFGHIQNNNGQAPYKGMLINMKGEVIKTYTNFNILKSKGSRINGGSTQIYSFEKSVNFKEQFVDTLFFIDNKYNLIPRFSFRMGSLKMPESVRTNFFEYFQKINDYYALENILESQGYLFIDMNFGSHFPVEHITVETNSGQAQEESSINTTHCLGIYNKKTGKLVFCRPTGTDNPLNLTGLYNDLDGGPRFFPERMLNDSTMIMVVSARDLINHVNSKDFINSKTKHPDKKEQLRELAGRLSEDSNPVLILLHLN